MNATIDDVKQVTLQQLPIPEADMRTLAGTSGIHGALYQDGKAIVWGPACHLKSEAQAVAMYPGAALVWHKAQRSRVDLAITMMADQGITAHAAAHKVGVHVSAVYRAQRLRETRAVCECCGQVLPT